MTDKPRALLAPADATRLIKFCKLFASDKIGEVAAAAAKANNLVTKLGLTWDTVFMPPAPPERPSPFEQQYRSSSYRNTYDYDDDETFDDDDRLFIIRHRKELTPWEENFIGSVHTRYELTPKQAAVVDRIVKKLRDRGCV
jgi:hypothetical protein